MRPGGWGAMASACRAGYRSWAEQRTAELIPFVGQSSGASDAKAEANQKLGTAGMATQVERADRGVGRLGIVGGV